MRYFINQAGDKKLFDGGVGFMKFILYVAAFFILFKFIVPHLRLTFGIPGQSRSTLTTRS
jgi:hypothetical protein